MSKIDAMDSLLMRETIRAMVRKCETAAGSEAASGLRIRRMTVRSKVRCTAFHATVWLVSSTVSMR